MKQMPALDARYWAALCAASMFGANMGDFFSHNLHLGHFRGLPFLAAGFVLVFLSGRRARVRSDAYYWLAIVIVRTAATNLADLATHDFKLGYAWVTAGLVVLLAASLLPAIRRSTAGRPADPAPPDGWYWMSMLIAGTLGTAIGDGLADGMGLGTGAASLALGVGAAILLAAWTRATVWTAAFYWMAVVAIRAAGTTASDFLAGRHGLGLGLPFSTACTGLMLLAVLVLWRRSAPGHHLAPLGGRQAGAE